ncbi:MAG: UDP-N-acetylmuramoylalanine--D-glutamate ligase [Bacteroidetes bacterium RIFOXYA12_FULL_35_11]|nr:MAG: UDP-N-acetylmuramoylalanine--D-glutamate ligase [Bacteroidetes bacterium GWF2_35_48]OFY79256.1 MAG: UDP-N-acetylmuramoylalanine--D-glutamate ligase [Bacteroidetes bacterium RIFOXYA12_FULL_35_11]OFY96237.1 MAG: UDP-N-acetylmuramoylalanine--D-glutamate ligase [Bacteroidetes bacterium RIFOXYB2_FULL_35_7]HBX50501.1 UDP-N-acetylmuramoyl-L-alanine--D-glutamate ligase [Bacteroidales bacterium]
MQKRMVILGGGESGTGAAVLANGKGFDVFLSDFGEIKPKYKKLLEKNKISWEEKQHTEALILNADEIIKSPGIPDKLPIVKKIKAKKIPVISEIEFAGRYTNAIKICITGSNGKTTTTLLTYEILKKAGLNVGLAGNVGNSFALQVHEKNYDYYVIELSSFQLDDMYDFKAEIAVLMNITPDHLDRYDYKFQKYINSKFRVTQNQTEEDHFIYCSDDLVIVQELEKRKIKSQKYPFSLTQETQQGAYSKDNNIIIKTTNTEFSMTIHELALQGRHNTYNSMAASIGSQIINIRKNVIRESLMEFKGVEHRLEQVIMVHGVEFINDSKATNINSTWYALESMKKPIVWIVGGQDKGNDYSMLLDLVKDKVKAIICLGIDNSKIIASFKPLGKTMVEAKSMTDAIAACYKLAKKGDVVLLSPACASFDLFENYEDRGRQFKKCVREL